MFHGFLLLAMAGVPASELKVTPSGSSFVLELGKSGVFRTTRQSVSEPASHKVGDLTIGTWKEAGTRRYAILGAQPKGVVQAVGDDRIHLKNGAFDPKTTIVPASSSVQTPADNEVRLIQFSTQPMPEYLDALQAAGAVIYDTIAPNAAIVRASAKSMITIRNLPFVRYAGEYRTEFRLDPTLLSKLEAGTLGTRRYNIWCHQRGLAMQQAVANEVALLGGSVNQLIAPGFMMSATLSPVQLSQILALPEVSYVDAYSEPETDMNIVRATGGANFIETTLGFTGQGVRAEVMDGGLLTTHSAWTNAPLIHAPSMVTDSHGTATFGINFGNGTSNAAGRGLLPNAQGVMARYSAFSGGNRYTHTAELLQAPYFCVYQSNSWGDATTTAYTTISAQMDDILSLNDITILNSQSNTGNQLSRPQAWAKNVVSIGAVNHFGTLATTDDLWQNGASIGPAADGRMKPDLCFYYDQITCPTSTSTTAYTTSFGGTSAATPITAGHFGLFFQMWHNGIFGNPAPAATVFDNRPKATLAKALMMNTATQYPLGPQQGDITRFVQGFGRADLTNLYGVRENIFWVNETQALQNLQTATYRLQVASGTPALRLTMAYTDPAGTPAAAFARKNNLSLRVTGPTGTIWRGNQGMTTSNWTASGGSEDTINTVENVFIQNPGAGVYTVEVIGSDINTDARAETPGVIDADFALVGTGMVSGNLAPSAFAVLDGGLVSGNLASLGLSDNNKVAATRGANGSRFFRSVTEMTFTSPTTTCSRMNFLFERAAPSAGTTEVVEIWDPALLTWVPVSSGPTPTADGLLSVAIPSPQTYVGNGNQIKIRCAFERQDQFGSRTANVQMDYARLQVEP